MKNTILILITLSLFFACNSVKKTDKIEEKQELKTNQKIIWISSQTKNCDAGVMQKECLLVKYSENQKDWEYFYSDIQGFDYKKGTEYQIIVKTENISNPPQDTSSIKYTLVKIISEIKK